MSDDEEFTPGPTGLYPQGKARPDDQGELAAALHTHPEKELLIMDFNTAVSWLAMTLPEARILVETLSKRIGEAEEEFAKRRGPH